MSPANLTGATADIVTLQGEVNAGKNASLVSGRPENIASALRLHTRVNQTGDRAEVAVYFHYTNDGGLFNGMLFKDMVANGIRFEYSFFKANVTYGSEEAAPAIKLAVYSPSTKAWTSFVWEPYQQGTGNPNENEWISNVVLTTNGTSTNPITTTSGNGWWNSYWVPDLNLRQSHLSNLAAWVTHLNTSFPLVMADAIVEHVRIGVGSNNPGVTSYVNSLRIAVGDYDWKWTFGG